MISGVMIVKYRERIFSRELRLKTTFTFTFIIVNYKAITHYMQ